jgi:hypothetical protein
MKMAVALEEQETVIQFNRGDAGATIYTSDSTMMTKLDKMCAASPDYYSVDREETEDGKVVGKFYKLTDKTRISFRKNKVERVFTEEQKRQLAANLARSRNQNLDDSDNELL